MSYWNYRVVRKVSEGDSYFEVHEVYYTDDDRIEGWSVEPMSPSGNTFEELGKDLAYMTQALERPLLEEITGDNGKQKLVEVGEKPATSCRLG